MWALSRHLSSANPQRTAPNDRHVQLVAPIMYSVLFLVGCVRLHAHRSQWRQFGPKFGFHFVLVLFAASRVGFSVLDGIENGGKTSISIPYLVIGCFAYAFNFILLLFLDIHWRDVMNASNSKKSRQNWAGFVLISVAFIIAVVALSVADYIRNHDAGHSYAEFAIDLIFILISLRYMWASLRIYRKIRQSGITEGVILRAVITFVVIMASAAVLMVIRTAVDLYYSVNNEPAMVWWWYALIEWLPDVPPCFGYMYLMWGSEHVREDILEDDKGGNATLLSKLLDDTHDPFSIRSPGDEAASFANLLETPRLHPTNTRPQRAGPSSLFSLKEVSNELAGDNLATHSGPVSVTSADVSLKSAQSKPVNFEGAESSVTSRAFARVIKDSTANSMKQPYERLWTTWVKLMERYQRAKGRNAWASTPTSDGSSFDSSPTPSGSITLAVPRSVTTVGTWVLVTLRASNVPLDGKWAKNLVKSIANSNTTSYSGRVAGRVYVIVNYFQAAPKVPGKTGGIREAPQFLFGGSTEIAPLCEVAPITKPPVSGLMSTPGPKLSRRSSLEGLSASHGRGGRSMTAHAGDIVASLAALTATPSKGGDNRRGSASSIPVSDTSSVHDPRGISPVGFPAPAGPVSPQSSELLLDAVPAMQRSSTRQSSSHEARGVTHNIAPKPPHASTSLGGHTALSRDGKGGAGKQDFVDNEDGEGFVGTGAGGASVAASKKKKRSSVGSLVKPPKVMYNWTIRSDELVEQHLTADTVLSTDTRRCHLSDETDRALLETKVEAFWRRKVGPNVMTRAFTAFNKGPAGLETVAEAVESPNMTTRRSSFMDVDALDRKMGLAAQTDRAVSTMQLSPDMLAAAAENEPFAHGNTADAPGSVMFTSLCESNCAVVVPRLLLPYIFRKRRSQLGSVREIYRRYLETVTSRKDADKRRGDAKDAQTGLYDMLIRHLQSTAVHSSTQDWLRNRSIELAEYCNDLADIFSCAGSGVPFKSSMLKKDKATRFTATNLHVETFAVMPMVTSLDDEEDENGGLVKAPCEKLLRMAKMPAAYNTVTVGAPAAHHMKFKGGLGIGSMYNKLLTQQRLVEDLLSSSRAARLDFNAAKVEAEDTLFYVRRRADIAVCQAVSALVACFVSQMRAAFKLQRLHAASDRACAKPAAGLSSDAREVGEGPGFGYLKQVSSLGFMFIWESLLSTVGSEYGMLDDMQVAITLLRYFSFALVDAQTTQPSPEANHASRRQRTGARRHPTPAPQAPDKHEYSDSDSECEDDTSPTAGMLRITVRNISIYPNSEGAGFIVSIPVTGLTAAVEQRLVPRSLVLADAAVLNKRSDSSFLSKLVPVWPLLITQGINEMQAAGNFVRDGGVALQHSIVENTVHLLTKYVQRYIRFVAESNNVPVPSKASFYAYLSVLRTPISPALVKQPNSAQGRSGEWKSAFHAAKGEDNRRDLFRDDSGTSSDTFGGLPGSSNRSTVLREMAIRNLGNSAAAAATTKSLDRLPSVLDGSPSMSPTVDDMNMKSDEKPAKRIQLTDHDLLTIADWFPIPSAVAAERQAQRELLSGGPAAVGAITAALARPVPSKPVPVPASEVVIRVADTVDQRITVPSSLVKESSSLNSGSMMDKAAPVKLTATASPVPPVDAADLSDSPFVPTPRTDAPPLIPESTYTANAELCGVWGDVALLDMPDAEIHRARLIMHYLKCLHRAVEQSKAKTIRNTDILRYSSMLCRLLRGGRIMSCKSAKDRTGMAVTLEEARMLELAHGLPSRHFQDVMDLLRSHGVRLDNAEKNTGKRAYCFNALQRAVFPNLYKCPAGTGGGGVT